MLVNLLIAVFVLIAVAVAPLWSYSRRWGYSPAIGIAIIALVFLVMHLSYLI